MLFFRIHQRKSIRFAASLLLFLPFCILIFYSCDQTFEPLQENDKYYFSIYGYLDAAADTQWVRVGPTRQDINEPPDPTGIKVTLEHIQSGKTIVMNDSLFASKGFLNYWTTMNIKNEQTYRITAERDGKASWVTVTIPQEIPDPYVVQNDFPRGYNVYVDDGVRHIADVQSVWYVTLNPHLKPNEEYIHLASGTRLNIRVPTVNLILLLQIIWQKRTTLIKVPAALTFLLRKDNFL